MLLICIVKIKRNITGKYYCAKCFSNITSLFDNNIKYDLYRQHIILNFKLLHKRFFPSVTNFSYYDGMALIFIFFIFYLQNATTI